MVQQVSPPKVQVPVATPVSNQTNVVVPKEVKKKSKWWLFLIIIIISLGLGVLAGYFIF